MIDWAVWGALGAAAAMALWAVRLGTAAAREATGAAQALATRVERLDGTAAALAAGQERLSGGLTQVAEAQTKAQLLMLETVERRLEDVQRQMADSLHGATARTTRTMTEVQERLAVIDRAQGNLERLSGEVLSLQDILSNKQARGAFGEVQLEAIVRDALPPATYRFQATLSNGRRADCLIDLPPPAGPIAVDAKFPLEAYEALMAAEAPPARDRALRDLRSAVRGHVRAIAERYVLPGETGEGAVMFLPSEAVYAALHTHAAEVVREAHGAKVWITSPTTLMAVLTTLAAVVRDRRLAEAQGVVRAELQGLAKALAALGADAVKLDRHFGQVVADVAAVGRRAQQGAARAADLAEGRFQAPDADAPLTGEGALTNGAGRAADRAEIG